MEAFCSDVNNVFILAISVWNQRETITIGTVLSGVGSVFTGWGYCKGFTSKNTRSMFMLSCFVSIHIYVHNSYFL